MATVICGTKKDKEVIPRMLCELLPYRLTDEIRSLGLSVIEEIRLRSNRAASLTLPSGNRMLQTVLSPMELENILQVICDGSLYAHSETISQGYVTLRGGIRVGICGRATTEEGKILGVYGVSGLNLRLPARHRCVGAPVVHMLRSMKPAGSVLIYSPPGVGKTTLLRNVAAEMAMGNDPLRVAVVDSRGELAPFLDETRLCLDVLSGYPKPAGIEIACRTLNAQLIVCDEIGDRAEAEAIVAAQNCGVSFIATAHASSVEGLLRRTSLAVLHQARVFDRYVGICRRAEGGDYCYTITDWEEANVDMQAIRCRDACV